MQVTGKVSECSKTEKAYKMVVEGKNYYCQENILDFAGKVVEFEYKMSKLYQSHGKQVQSRLVKLEDIKEVTEKQEPKQEGKPDWDGKELRGIRSMAISYAKDLVVADKLMNADIEKCAEDMVKFIYNGLGNPDDNIELGG